MHKDNKEIIPDTEVLSNDFMDITEVISSDPEEKTEPEVQNANVENTTRKLSALEITLIVAVCILLVILICLLVF